MSLRVKHLNADSSFLLLFSPLQASDDPIDTIPGSFTILVDPWLSGPSKVWNSHFAITHHVIPSCVDSLEDLPTPDVVVISQDKTDHCHKGTLKQLHPDAETIVVGPPAAAKTIKSWKHFRPKQVIPLKRFDPKRNDTLLRIPVPASTPSGAAGEVTISLMVNKIDMTGLHNAIGITYRPPSAAVSGLKSASYVDLPLTPPASPPPSLKSMKRPSTPASSIVYPASTTLHPSPYGNREKSMSVIYSPHGCGYDIIKPYATSHLLAEAALPLTALFHSWNRATNPWYLGGNICGGYPDGADIALHLFANVWISAHDEEKLSTGVSVKAVKIEKYQMDEVKKNLDALANMNGKSKKGSRTQVMQLEVGEEHLIRAKC